MGQNPCKHLVEGGGRIGEEEFQALLHRYDKDKNGELSKEETEKFLKDLCKALGTRFDKQNAIRIFSRCDKEQRGALSLAEFTNLFHQAIKEAEMQGSSKAKQLSVNAGASTPPPTPSAPAPSRQDSAPKPQQAPPPQSSPSPSPSSSSSSSSSVRREPSQPILTPKQKRYNEAFSGSSRIDRDEIKLGKLIGKGQFGQVYIGDCRGMECAIKIPNLTLGGAKFDLLLNELEIMKKANNPHVAMFMGACHDKKTDKILIVMELMVGDAESKCKEPEHPLSVRLDWIRQACKGQAWLHEMSSPILHLDLKPSNILYDDRGFFKVCDFGLSAVLPEGEKTLFMNRMKGTPIYMAPEIMIPGEFPVSHKSDTYSMAITAWEMCLGKACFSEYKALPPFRHDVHRMHKRPPLPSHWLPSLVELFNDMWHHSPLQRPSFTEIVMRLDVIIPQVEQQEYLSELTKQVKNPAGVEWWSANFPGKYKVDWETFYPIFFKYLGKSVPKDPSELGDNPDQWALANATNAQLERLASRGALQKVAAETEFERRKQSHEFNKASSAEPSFGSYRSYQKFNDEEINLLCLKGLVGVSSQNEEGVVDATHFGQLLAYFGPLDGNLLNRVVDLLSKPYFHAFKTSNQAQDLLLNSDNGTFLVRFSATRWGQVIITVKSNGKVTHFVVQNENQRFRYKQKVDKWWDSVPKLIDDHRDSLQLLNPQDGGPFISLFHEPMNELAGYADGDDLDDDDY